MPETSRTVLVTGANGALGKATALELARQGWTVGMAPVIKHAARPPEPRWRNAPGTPMPTSCWRIYFR